MTPRTYCTSSPLQPLLLAGILSFLMVADPTPLDPPGASPPPPGEDGQPPPREPSFCVTRHGDRFEQVPGGALARAAAAEAAQYGSIAAETAFSRAQQDDVAWARCPVPVKELVRAPGWPEPARAGIAGA